MKMIEKKRRTDAVGHNSSISEQVIQLLIRPTAAVGMMDPS